MEKRPNIIYILADDMGYGDLSCLNENSKIHTENLDAMASSGISFTDAHSTSAVCTPSRYSILTGRYNWRSRLKKSIISGYSPPLIEPGRMTAASLLKKHGYRTACIGKWHLGWTWARNGAGERDVDFAKPISGGPGSFGFDYFFGISASLDAPPYVYVENENPTAVPDRVITECGGKKFRRPGPGAPDFAHEKTLAVFKERGLNFISECAKNKHPFFLYFPLTAPHTPIIPESRYRGASGTNEYGDFCLQVDGIAGEIVRLLEEKGIDENTIIVFTSDNGCSPMADFRELAGYGHNPSYIFRGHKADIFEGGHRVPLIVRWPEAIAPGTVSEETVCLVDFLATCADILGYQMPDTAGEDSISNLPAWKKQEPATSLREATVHHSIDGSFAIRKGRWKLEMCPGSGGWSYPRPGKECEGLPGIQLYDMENDPGEITNVFEHNPGVVDELKQLLASYIKNGRSTPGSPQKNTGSPFWDQISWMRQNGNSGAEGL